MAQSARKPKRKPNRETAAEQARKEAAVIAARTEGKSFEEAAKAAGYRSRKAAWEAYQRVMARNEADDVTAMRLLQWERAERIISDAFAALEHAETMSDRKRAWDAILSASNFIANLYGLHTPAQPAEDVAESARVEDTLRKVQSELDVSDDEVAEARRTLRVVTGGA